jgi:hypothetical protein
MTAGLVILADAGHAQVENVVLMPVILSGPVVLDNSPEHPC